MKTLKRMTFVLIAGICLIILTAVIILNQKKFGRAPSGERLERIKNSPHYINGKFENLEETPQLSEDTSMPEIMFRFLFGKKENLKPSKKLLFTKTDLKKIPPDEDVYIWMGHSSYFIQMDGIKILVDPGFSGYASPFAFTTRAFEGSDLYTVDDLPEIDFLIITHDHWDHLDYETITQIKSKVKKVVTGLGTGEHLEYWNYSPNKITELDWGEKSTFESGVKIYCETARHFSGRGLKRNQAIWASFVIETPTQRIYLGGDSGYGEHFKKIGEKFGDFDLVILENGQYNKDWRNIHFMPGENLQAMTDLRAKRMIPVHNSKFSLATHSWDEPLEKILEMNNNKHRVILPQIGEKINWLDDSKVYDKWWDKYTD